MIAASSAEAAAALNVHCASLAERGVEARAAAFISTSAGADTSRLATEQDVDLILVSAGPALLDDPDLGELLRTAPCDVGHRRRRAGSRQALSSSRSPAPSTTGARSSSAPGSPAAGRCRSGSQGPPSRAAATRAACLQAPRSQFSARSASRRSRSSSRPAPRRSSRPRATPRSPSSASPTAGARTASGRRAARSPRRDGRRSSCARAFGPGGLAPAENLTRFTWSILG